MSVEPTGDRVAKGCLFVMAVFVLTPVVLLAAFIAYATAVEWWTSGTVNYRLTLVVRADGQDHTGSGVLQTRCHGRLVVVLDSPGPPCQGSGEAIPVDLGPRGILFVTLYGRQIDRDVNTGPAYLPWLAFPDVGKDALGHRFYASELRALERDRPKTDLAFGLLPMLVRFRDIKDPKSVEKVDPDHLDAAFGPGAKLVKATIAVTDDWVTGGISKVLPWVDTQKGPLDGSVLHNSNKTSNVLSSLDFKPWTNQ